MSKQENLRAAIASQISNWKAYDVPKICSSIGLEDGTNEEAFQSKYKYANSRLIGLNINALLKIAKKLLDVEESHQISQVIATIEERETPQITKLTRRRILKIFESSPVCSELDFIDFLRENFPLQEMQAPAQGYYPHLEEYIVQHFLRNDDISEVDVLEALGLLSSSTAFFSKFCSAVTSPEANNSRAQTSLRAQISSYLKKDGFDLIRSGQISGEPTFGVTFVGANQPAGPAISKTLEAFDPELIHQRWSLAVERTKAEPEGAITLARTLLEDVCKFILTESQDESWKYSDDLPVLYKKLTKQLNLAPDDHTEQIFQQILSGCHSVVQGLGSLRNKLGDAHSPGPKRIRPSVRHAELAVNLSGAMSSFLIQTWETKKPDQ